MAQTIQKSVYNLSGIFRLFESDDENELIKNIRLKISDKDLKKIPKHGGFITVSNRPIGAIEEIILAKIIHTVRPDYFFLQNPFLKDLKKFNENYLVEDYLLSIHDIVNNGNGVGLFPVGNISEFQALDKSFADSKWDMGKIREMRASNAPLVPVYINVENENVFKMLGLIHPVLKTRKAISNIISNEGLEAIIRIGKPIKKANVDHLGSHGELGRFLRAKLYSLGTKLTVDDFFKNKNITKVVDPIPEKELEKELNAISDTNKIGEQGNFEVYIAKAKKIPKTIIEIGRLREITFRKANEGTNNQIDLDEYDLHYLHLFIWDKKDKKIAGAYRMGNGEYIMKILGKKGFYLRSLFKIDKHLNELLSQSIELGRSFVTPEYQNKRLPLYLLWKGIAYYIRTNPSLKYLIGPVSISNAYSKLSRSFMVAFIKKYHWDANLAEHIKPLKKFKPVFEGLDHEILIEGTNKNIKLLDHIIEDVENKETRTPVLLKKYFNQNARIIGFNIDPDFNDALDGFMITDISDLPEESLETFGF